MLSEESFFHQTNLTMSTQNLFSLFSILLMLFVSSTIYSQDMLKTFEMEFGGEKVMATRDVDTQLLGSYVQSGGKCKRMFTFSEGENDSYILTQTLIDGKEKSYEWNHNHKQAIEWGILTVDNKVAYMQVKEYSEGNMVTYTGVVILYKDLKTQTYKDILLYKVNGNLVLGGFATKVTEVVAN